MDCELMDEKISNFHFGVVTEGERARIEAHLANCAACLRELFIFKAAVEEGARLDAAPSRPAFFPRPVARRYARVAMAAALLVALAGGAEWWWHAGPASSTRVTAFDSADTGDARLATYHIF